MPHERTPEQDVPFLEKLKRMLPSMLGGRPGDQRLPMEAGTMQDPRLPAPSGFDAIRQGLETVRDLGRPKDPAEDAMAAIRRMSGGLKK